MKYLQLALSALLGLALISGCSSSSTSGSGSTGSSSGHSQKAADNEANELIASAMTMSDAERHTKGEAMAKRIKELRSQVSEETGKRIDSLFAMSVRSESSSQRASVHADSEASEVRSPPRATRPADQEPSTAPPSRTNELLPQPREVK